MVDVRPYDKSEKAAHQGRYKAEFHRKDLAYTETVKDLDFDLVLCWIENPETKFKGDLTEPFEYDFSKNTIDTMTIELSELLLTEDPACGNLIYSAYSQSEEDENFDVFSVEESKATIDDTTIIFNEMSKYPAGVLDVTVTVK